VKCKSMRLDRRHFNDGFSSKAFVLDRSDAMLHAGQTSADAGERMASVSSEGIDVTELGFEGIAAAPEAAPAEVTSSCSVTLLISAPTQAAAHWPPHP